MSTNDLPGPSAPGGSRFAPPMLVTNNSLENHTGRTARSGMAGSGEGIRKNKPRNRARKAILAGVAIVVALIWAFPVYWMVNSSMYDNFTLNRTTPTFLPFGGSFKNYVDVLTGQAAASSGIISFVEALRLSLIVTLFTLVFVLIFAFLAALAISRFRFRGRKTFILAILFIQMLPAEGMFLAQYRMMANAGLANTWFGLSILYIAAVVPFTVWMLRGFVAGVPVELEEAAMVDGLSRSQAFFRITFPLLAPGLVAAGVYAFLQAWNEYTVAYVILGKADITLPLWLQAFLGSSRGHEIEWGQVMAASTLIAIPVIIFFMFVQGRMTSGLVAGAVKG